MGAGIPARLAHLPRWRAWRLRRSQLYRGDASRSSHDLDRRRPSRRSRGAGVPARLRRLRDPRSGGRPERRHDGEGGRCRPDAARRQAPGPRRTRRAGPGQGSPPRTARRDDQRPRRSRHRGGRGATRRLRLPAEAVRQRPSAAVDQECAARRAPADREPRPARGDGGRPPTARPEPGHRPGAHDHHQGRADRRRRAGDRRERHRQGTGRAPTAPAEPSRPGSVRRPQLCGDPRGPGRERAVRPREGRLHGGHCGPRRRLRAGRWRHAVPRRSRRHAATDASEAAARAAGTRRAATR